MIKNDRIVSIHIKKTAGTSIYVFLKKIYGSRNVYLYYPTLGGIFRADKDPIGSIRNIPLLVKLKRIFRSTKIGKLVYKSLVSFIIPSTSTSISKNKKIPLPKKFSVVHGHFQPRSVDLKGSKLVTIVREPLERAISHFNWYKSVVKQGFHKVPTWFKDGMSFEQYSTHVVNYQTKFLNNLTPNDFYFIGVTEHLEPFAERFDPSRKHKIKRLNVGDKYQGLNLSLEFIKKFKKVNSKDYEFYKAALKLNGIAV